MSPGGYLAPWSPLERIPHDDIDPRYLVLHEQGDVDVEVWKSDRYEVTVRVARNGTRMRHLSINLHDRGPARNWRHLQQIKNEVCGEDWTGVEVFPPEHLLTDAANQYHIFCFPPEFEFPEGMDLAGFGLSTESLVTSDEAAERWNDAPHKGRQEPWEPGLTTGRTDASRPARERLEERASG